LPLLFSGRVSILIDSTPEEKRIKKKKIKAPMKPE
jgi:hypothetical protein